MWRQGQGGPSHPHLLGKTHSEISVVDAGIRGVSDSASFSDPCSGPLERELGLLVRNQYNVMAIEAFERSYAQGHTGRFDPDEHRCKAIWARMKINFVGREAKKRFRSRHIVDPLINLTVNSVQLGVGCGPKFIRATRSCTALSDLVIGSVTLRRDALHRKRSHSHLCVPVPWRSLSGRQPGSGKWPASRLRRQLAVQYVAAERIAVTLWKFEVSHSRISPRC